MFNRVIITLAIIMHVIIIASAQTIDQKQAVYNQACIFSKAKVFSKTNPPVGSYDDFFNAADLLPIYKLNLNCEGQPVLFNDNKNFLILSANNAYLYNNGRTTTLTESNKLIKKIRTFKEQNKSFQLCHFIDEYTWRGEDLSIAITDSAFNFVSHRGNSYPDMLACINANYGSIAKYQEKLKQDNKRNSLKFEEIPNIIKYEVEYGKDTLLSIHALIDQIADATVISSEQRAALFQHFRKTIRAAENLPSVNEGFQKGYFTLYGLNITNDLLMMLTRQQFLDYKNYVNIYSPLYSSGWGMPTGRYGYPHIIFNKEKKLNYNSQKEYKAYLDQLKAEYKSTSHAISKGKIEANATEPAHWDTLRSALTIADAENAIKYDYHIQESLCPQDTDLVLNAFTSQLKAVVGLSAAQEKLLTNRLNHRINPYKNYKLPDSTAVKMKNQLVLAGWYTKKNLGVYDISLYNIDITTVLLELLTDKQFIDYIDYLDLYYPAKSNSSRGNYAADLYKKEKDLPAYINSIMNECGCKHKLLFNPDVLKEIMQTR